MKKAVRFDNEEVNKAIRSVDTTQSRMIHVMKHYNNRSVTENGAIGYKTTTHPLLDLNFKVSSLRNMKEEMIKEMFVKAYYEDRRYAVKWLFFLRDVLEGLGERRSFRVCLSYLIESHPDIALAIMPLIPEYGRYDDLLVYVDSSLCHKVCKFMKRQLIKDLEAMHMEEPVSLLAKWLPSINTSSKETKRLAGMIVKEFGMSARAYRKRLSSLRKYMDVVEVKLSKSAWEDVDYQKVPAKANLKYNLAFIKHDEERRMDYLQSATLEHSQLNIKGLAPHEIVHRMKDGWYGMRNHNFIMEEIMWSCMLEDGFKNDWGLDDCIVVADGSGSMYSHVTGNTKVRAIDVCHSLAIYFAEQLKGVFHNKVISFSDNPVLIDLEQGNSLREKLEIMDTYDEVSSTNIEAVFDMLLMLAVDKNVSPEELPKQVLIISDMEFNEATDSSIWRYGRSTVTSPKFDETLFDTISRRYREAGYTIPRLIFWNVCGRSDTIPMVEGDSGICLLSGFSQNAVKVATSKEHKDPYTCLLQALDSPRYDKVEQTLKKVAA